MSILAKQHKEFPSIPVEIPVDLGNMIITFNKNSNVYDKRRLPGTAAAQILHDKLLNTS